jgi:hypothetical protein
VRASIGMRAAVRVRCCGRACAFVAVHVRRTAKREEWYYQKSGEWRARTSTVKPVEQIYADNKAYFGNVQDQAEFRFVRPFPRPRHAASNASTNLRVSNEEAAHLRLLPRRASEEALTPSQRPLLHPGV